MLQEKLHNQAVVIVGRIIDNIQKQAFNEINKLPGYNNWGWNEQLRCCKLAIEIFKVFGDKISAEKHPLLTEIVKNTESEIEENLLKKVSE